MLPLRWCPLGAPPQSLPLPPLSPHQTLESATTPLPAGDPPIPSTPTTTQEAQGCTGGQGVNPPSVWTASPLPLQDGSVLVGFRVDQTEALLQVKNNTTLEIYDGCQNKAAKFFGPLCQQGVPLILYKKYKVLFYQYCFRKWRLPSLRQQQWASSEEAERAQEAQGWDRFSLCRHQRVLGRSLGGGRGGLRRRLPGRRELKDQEGKNVFQTPSTPDYEGSLPGKK